MNDQLCTLLLDSQKLTHSSNYGPWKHRMKLILMAAGLWEIVDPTKQLSNESCSTSSFNKESQRTKALLILQSSVSNKTKNILFGIEDPRECWIMLQNHFAPCTLDRKMHLFEILCGLKLNEGEDIEKLFSTFLKLRNDLQDVGVILKDDEMVLRILSALPKSWKFFVENCKVIGNLKGLTLDGFYQKMRTEQQWKEIMGL
jgi:hypothetical protein